METNAYDPTFDEVWDKYTKSVRDRLRHEIEKAGDVEYSAVVSGIDEYFSSLDHSRRKRSILSGEHIFLIVTAALTLVFGGFGLVLKDNPEGFLDIAKIFAGAVVGGAAGSAALSASTRSR